MAHRRSAEQTVEAVVGESWESSVAIVGGTRECRTSAALRLHQLSTRANGPFVQLDCAGLTRDGFTAALRNADNGTLYLEHLDRAHLGIQALMTRAVLRSESDELPEVDVRYMAGTDGTDEWESDLARGIAEGRVRADLFHRLHGRIVKL